MKNKKIISAGILTSNKIGKIESFEEELKPPGPQEVTLRVKRAGVAFGDIMRSREVVMKIKKYPFVPGYDVSGVIAAVGNKVKGFKEGDRVTAFCMVGGYSQAINIKSKQVHKIPDKINFEDAAALNLNYLTAYQMLTRTAKIKERQSVLIHSAAGGVGSAALQLAKYLGAVIYGTGSTTKQEFIRSQGGIPIDYTKEDFREVLRKEIPEGVDAALESLGLENAYKTREIVKKRGHLVLFGFLGMTGSPLIHNMGAFGKELMKLMFFTKGRKSHFYSIAPEKKNQWYHKDLEILMELAADKKIKPVIHTVLPLTEAAKAQELLLSRKVIGKIILDCE